MILAGMLALTGGVLPTSVQGQMKYTLTNGRLWWYEGAQNAGHKMPVAVVQGTWREQHWYDEVNVTHITNMGDIYLALDTTGGGARLVTKDTSDFDPLCVWNYISTSGLYYQTHFSPRDGNTYSYYISGSRTRLGVVKQLSSAAQDDMTKWYSWDFGAAITDVTYRNGKRTESYYWMMLDTTGHPADPLNGEWKMSCNSYQRPEDIQYKRLSADSASSEVYKTYYCPRTLGSIDIPAGNGALFMPVTVTEHGTEIAEIADGKGFQELLLRDNADHTTAKSTLRNGETLDLTTRIENNDGALTVRVTEPYAEFRQEIYRYGINLSYTDREDENKWNSKGFGTFRSYYYWSSDPFTRQNRPPTGTDQVLKVDSITYSLNGASRRYLELSHTVMKNTGGENVYNPTVTVNCFTVPPKNAVATVTVTVYYTNGTSETRTEQITMDNRVEHSPMPAPEHAPVIHGYVVGGGRMANVNGNTNITVHSCDSIYALYGGNDIAGWVQGEDGATIQLGTAKTDASHPVNIGYVYGGGCGYYTYRGINFGVDENGTPNIYPYEFGRDNIPDTVNTSLIYQSYFFNGEVYPWNYIPRGEVWDPDANGGTGAWVEYTPSNYDTILPVDTVGLHWNWEYDAGGADQRVVPYQFYYNPLYSNPAEVDNNETGDHGNGTIPYIKKAHITVGVDSTGVGSAGTRDATARTHNDYIVIDSLFGGAENAFIGVESDIEASPERGVTIDINGGTIYSVFGGNNYGGSVANTATVFVNVHSTKYPAGQQKSDGTFRTPDDPLYVPVTDLSHYAGIGREYGIRYLFGGGNLVESSHAATFITGGIMDTVFGGGNRASVKNPIVDVNCTGKNFIMSNPSYDTTGYSTEDPEDWTFGPDYWEGETGHYNIRTLFGGNNKAPMENLSLIMLESGGISCVYGGGNEGDMNWTGGLTRPAYIALMSRAMYNNALPYPQGVSSIVCAQKNSKIICDYVFGGCRMANVKASCGVSLSGGIFGYVNGGNDVSGDIGSRRQSHYDEVAFTAPFTPTDAHRKLQDGSYVILDDSVFIVGDVVGNSDGYYHCDNGTGHYDNNHLYDTYDGTDYDEYEEFIGMLLPTSNHSHVSIQNNGEGKGPVVLGQVITGGVHANVGFPERKEGDNMILLNGEETVLSPADGIQRGSVHLEMTGGTVYGNVVGGGYMSSIFGLSYLHVGGNAVIKGSLFAGNDCLGGIESFGAYTKTDNTNIRVKESPEFASYMSSSLDSLNTWDGKQWNAAYDSYLKIDGTPRINSVYGSGNGAYDYDGTRPYYPSVSMCDDGRGINRPLQSSTYIDIATTGLQGGTTCNIDTVFGGGNGVSVRENVMVLLNASSNSFRAVGTIFGGNNRDDMVTCVPDIVLKNGKVKNVFGGGNRGSMRGGDEYGDLCGTPVDGVTTYIKIENNTAQIEDSLFGGCRMADVYGMAYIDIRNGVINHLFGGNDVSGTVKGNTRIDVSGGTVNEIHGGSNGKYDYDLVEGKYNIYQFKATHDAAHAVVLQWDNGSPFVDSTTVNLWGGTFNTDIFGGGSMGDCRATNVVVNSHACPAAEANALTINGTVYGGGEGYWRNLHEPHLGNLHGTDSIARSGSHVHLHYAETLTSAKAYGGGKGGDVDNTYITAYPTWGEPFEAIYGGCWGSDVMGTATVTMHGSSDPEAKTAERVFGGNDYTGTVYKTDVTILGGRYDNIFGGGNGEYTDYYDTGCYAGNWTPAEMTAFGHAEWAGDAFKTTKKLFEPNNEYCVLNFEDGTVEGNLYGGGLLGTTMRYEREYDGSGNEVGFKNAIGAHKWPDTFRSKYHLAVDGGGHHQANTDPDSLPYLDPTKYSYIIVNVKGGTFKQSIYAGGKGSPKVKGVEKVKWTVYGLKELNMEGGTVNESVYGGSENVDDGYTRECWNKDSTTMRPSSVLNITGGVVKSNVYGGGYLGNIYGSVYVNVGVDAVNECPLWGLTLYGQDSAYAKFKPGIKNGLVAALDTNELQLQSSIYGGANWGDNVGNANFNEPNVFGGVSRIIVDGKGYNTFMDGTQDELPLMNIVNSIIGSGTSANGGDINNRIDVRNYGAVNPSTCKPTRQLRAIQRTHSLWLHNTAVTYTGSTDAISAYLSNQVTINRVDTLNCVGYNVIDVEATMTNIAEVDFYRHADWPYRNLVLTSRTDIPSCQTSISGSCPVCEGSHTVCEELAYLDRDDELSRMTAMVMNNGINVDFIKDGTYSNVFGFALITAQKTTNAVITANAKYGNGGHYTDATRGVEYGGFVSSCADSMGTFQASGANGEVLAWTRCGVDPAACTDAKQYPYFNYGTAYRVWSVGEGVRRRYAVIQAHSNPDSLASNKKLTLHYTSTGIDSVYNFSLAHSELILPPTTPGHYYRINEKFGVLISDENEEMKLVDMGYLPTVRNWAATGGNSMTNTWKQDPSVVKYIDEENTPSEPGANGTLEVIRMDGGFTAMGVNEVHNNPGSYFGLMMASGSEFSGHAPKAHPLSTGDSPISGNDHVNIFTDFSTDTVASAENASPIIDLYLLYDNTFNHTMVGAVTFRLDEMVSVPRRANYDGSDPATNTGAIVPGEWIDSNLNAPIDVEITINTILQDFTDMEYEVLAMYNEGRSNVFSRKVILPATLQHRELYLRAITWAPTNTTTGNGEWLEPVLKDAEHPELGYKAPTNPDLFYLTDDPSVIINPSDPKHNKFGMTLMPMDNISNTLVTSVGWHSISLDEPIDLFKTAGKHGLDPQTASRMDVTYVEDTYNYKSDYYMDPEKRVDGTYIHRVDSARVTTTASIHGLKLGELDGRGEAALNISLNYDGSKVYDKIDGKGYVGKVVLTLVSFVGGDYEDSNMFHLVINVKTRELGDTIYMASKPTSLTRDGYTIHQYTGNFTSVDIENYCGKHPNSYLTNLGDAFKFIYQEGDVIAILDTLKIDNSQVFISGKEYMPVPIIRYDGHHHEFPDEGCVYRGTMVQVEGTGTLTTRCIDFRGGNVSKIKSKVVDPTSAWNTAHPKLYNAVKTEWNAVGEKDKWLYADTNRAYGPIIAVKGGGVVTMQNGTVVSQNWNGYSGNKADRYGAISVTDGGTLNMVNNVTIQQNLTDSIAGATPNWHIHPLSGAVHVDGGHLTILESNIKTAILIKDNFLKRNSGNADLDDYWESHNITVNGDPELMHYDFDTTKLYHHETVPAYSRANVWLARTAGGGDADLTDAKSNVVVFNEVLATNTRIGVSKWFPDNLESKRDTIRIAFQAAATHMAEAYTNNNFFADDTLYYTFYNYGVNNYNMYLQRCATFKHQRLASPAIDFFPAIADDPLTTEVDESRPASGITQGDAYSYLPLVGATCPVGGDTLVCRVQGGFFPYTYQWTRVDGAGNSAVRTVERTRTTAGANTTINNQTASRSFTGFKNAVADTLYTSNVDMPHNKATDTLRYTVTVNDVTGHCELKKNIKVTLVKDVTGSAANWVETSDATYDPHREGTVNGISAWIDTVYSKPNMVGDTARGTRNYHAVKITPRVWANPYYGSITAYDSELDSVFFLTGVGEDDTTLITNEFSFCEGDLLRLVTSPHYRDLGGGNREAIGKFIMWDFDPYYRNPVTYVVPPVNQTITAYYGPMDYWIEAVDATTDAGAVYDENYTYASRPTPTPAYSSTDGSAKAGYVTTYHGDVHIYDENGLAWFISVVNGLNGTQARPFYFNKVYLHKKADGTDYDMKDHLWTPVGTTQHRFRGWFKGVSATENDTATLPANERVVIKNIILDEDGLENVGFFAFLDTARIYNIELNSVLARGNQYVGALAARSQNAKILNCAVIDDAEGAYVPAAPPAPAQTYTTTILATHYVSGGMIGRSLNDSIVSSQVKAKYVGDAVYSGGIIGYGEGNKAALVDSRARNDNRMNGLYIGGIAGYLNGSAPVNSLAKTAPAMMVANNYVHMTTDGRSQRVGGIVGYATNAIIENNYVYGSLQGSATEGGVGAVLDEGSQSDHNYYEQSAVVKSAGQRRGNAAMSDNTGFSGSGNQVSLGQSVYGLNNLTRVLNRWVREHGNKYKSWRSDLEGVNDGYPYFGQPDLIPVTDDITFNNCDSVEWNGMVFTLDTVLVSHVIDSTEMIDSTSTLRFIIHHSSLTQYFDSSEVGHPYSGYGFELTAAESELLRSTVEQFGSAVLVLGDTLSNSEGCDSIIQLVLTFTDTKAVVMPTQKHINIYPNPTTDRVTVEATGLRRVELYDNEGRRLQDYTAPDRHDSLTIDVSAYASGFYYLRVHDSEGITIQKLIKK